MVHGKDDRVASFVMLDPFSVTSSAPLHAKDDPNSHFGDAVNAHMVAYLFPDVIRFSLKPRAAVLRPVTCAPQPTVLRNFCTGVGVQRKI